MSVVRPLALTAALATIVGLRWGLALGLPGEGLLVGLVFGGALLAAAIAGGWHLGRTHVRSGRGLRVSAAPLAARVGAGIAVGLLLVALAMLVGRDQLPALRPAAPFLPWIAITTLVATAEEIALRGALFGALEDTAGPAAAILVTSAVFALMHLPFYGWQALPLDLGVGLVFGGLRLASGGIAAPAVAHVIADAATWWL